MGWYTQVIFPRLCDFLLNRPFVANHRRELFAHARKRIEKSGIELDQRVLSSE